MTHPTASGPQPEDRGFRLDRRQASIVRALGRFDPHLAGLFEEAVRLLPQLDRPGRILLLSHAVRELTNGLGRHLSGLGFPPTHEAVEGAAELKEEAHRAIIAKALGRPPHHPSVSAWFKIHNEFKRTWHYWHPVRTVPNAAVVFGQFSDILWGLVGPFFETVRDLEELLSVEAPSPMQVESLHRALLRPAQRTQFFKRLTHPGWAEPLRAAGFFKDPPEPREHDGKWSWDLWPEGEFLRRVAKAAPAEVEAIIRELPHECTNPMVWERSMEAALELPIDAVGRLVRRFAKVVRVGRFRMVYADTAADLTVRLAESGHGAAFSLTRALLHVEDTEAESRHSWRRGSSGKYAQIGPLPEFRLEHLLPKLIAALETTDPEQTLHILCDCLADALKVEFGDARGERDERTRRWCKDLSAADPREGDARELVAVVAAGVGARWAVTGPEAAVRVLQVLAKHAGEIFRRLDLHTIAHAGGYLRPQLDAMVSDLTTVEEEYPPREYLLLLKRQFANASPGPRTLHIDAVRHGPATPDELRLLLTQAYGTPPTELDLERFRVRWQRKRLRRFGPNLPEELIELARELEHHPRVAPPSAEDVILDDQGFLVGGGWRSGPASPLSPDAISKLRPREIVEFLASYEPADDGIDAPTPAGLAQALSDAVGETPGLGSDLAGLLPAVGFRPAYVRAVLAGLLKGVEKALAIDWNRVLPVLRWVGLQEIGPGEAQRARFDGAEPNWGGAKREAARLLTLGAQRNLIPADAMAAAWEAVDAFVGQPANWHDSAVAESEAVENVNDAVLVALNHLGGDVATALLETALRSYRLDEKGFDPAPLRSAVTRILELAASDAVGPQVILGRYFPWWLLMDREWALGATARLFAGGFEPPRTNPAWGGYITAQRFFDTVFEALRPWYVAAARALPPNRHGGKETDRTWSPTRHLLSHVRTAMLHGLVAIGDPDQLLVAVFAGAPVEDCAHAYWEIFRGWEDAEERPLDDVVVRLLKLWSWRLDALEADPDTPDRAEEAGALGWLAHIGVLTDAEIMPLLRRSSVLAGGHLTTFDSLWGRLGAVAECDVSIAFEIAERVIQAVLASDYPHFNTEDVSPVLQRALRAGDPVTRDRARDLIHGLGEAGHDQFGPLLGMADG